jgi:SAM-dependent methyltransferase
MKLYNVHKDVMRYVKQMKSQSIQVKFPLYTKKESSFFVLTPLQRKVIRELNNKIVNHTYSLIPNSCLCGNRHAENDTLISEIDTVGILCDNYICSLCGLVRSGDVFDEKSLSQFYENEYKIIYYRSQEPNDDFFNSQVQRGEQFALLIDSLGISDRINDVFEVGSGMGGILMPFKNNGKRVGGCDFGVEYIEAAKERGIELYWGELSSNGHTPDLSQDLIILSHVMEHFTDPVTEMKKIIRKVRPGKYILVEVPGVFADAPYSYYPIWHLQRGHVINFFYKDFLSLFFSQLGLKVIYGDERCTFILQKPETYSVPNNPSFFDSSLEGYPDKVKNYFTEIFLKYDYPKYFNKVRLTRKLVYLLEDLGIRNLIRRLKQK